MWVDFPVGCCDHSTLCNCDHSSLIERDRKTGRPVQIFCTSLVLWSVLLLDPFELQACPVCHTQQLWSQLRSLRSKCVEVVVGVELNILRGEEYARLQCKEQQESCSAWQLVQNVQQAALPLSWQESLLQQTATIKGTRVDWSYRLKQKRKPQVYIIHLHVSGHVSEQESQSFLVPWCQTKAQIHFCPANFHNKLHVI
jgi:hypothetical protein